MSSPDRRLEEIQQALDLQNGRLDRIKDIQRQILDLLRGGGLGAGRCGWIMRSRAHPVRIGGAP